MDILCFSCHKNYEIDESRAVARNEECNHCGAATRCCKMCDFYDENSFNECREPMAERISEKEKPNFCNYFRLANKDKNENAKQERQSVLDAANALFKK